MPGAMSGEEEIPAGKGRKEQEADKSDVENDNPIGLEKGIDTGDLEGADIRGRNVEEDQNII